MLTPVDDLHLAHGYTLRDLHQMTTAACKADRLLAMPYEQRRDIAWSEIAVTLASAEDPPQRQELIRVGWQAIYRHVREGLRERGYRDDRDWSGANPTMPRFVQFWGSNITPSHEDRVVERVATRQVMVTITGVYRDAVIALAAFGDYQAAADALGISREALHQRINTARRTFLRRWHQGETPHRPRGINRLAPGTGKQPHCNAGHEWTPENTRTRSRIARGKVRTRRECRACERDRRRRRTGAAA